MHQVKEVWAGKAPLSRCNKLHYPVRVRREVHPSSTSRERVKNRSCKGQHYLLCQLGDGFYPMHAYFQRCNLLNLVRMGRAEARPYSGRAFYRENFSSGWEWEGTQALPCDMFDDPNSSPVLCVLCGVVHDPVQDGVFELFHRVQHEEFAVHLVWAGADGLEGFQRIRDLFDFIG